MVERIEKVSRVKGIAYDAYRPFERKEGYQDKGKAKQPFSQLLRSAIGRQEDSAAEAVPYRLDFTRATQSLFYLDGVDLRRAQEQMGKG